MEEINLEELNLEEKDITGIGDILNAYGSLCVVEYDNKFYWTITNDCLGDTWEEISETLYRELLKHNDKTK